MAKFLWRYLTPTNVLMFKKLFFPFLVKPKCPSLSELDCIYKKAFSDLPIFVREEYCQRLIDKSTYEMKQTKCPEEMKQLEMFITAAKKEIMLLKSQ